MAHRTRPRRVRPGSHDTALLRTKLHRPPVADAVVPRPRLLERLERGRTQPLTLVSAPAGYGKSTLLSSWLAVAGCRHGWVSLDEDDADQRIFLSYVVAAIEGAFPEACHRTRALLAAADLPPTRVLGATLVNELDALSEELILVLDDYHVIRSRAVHDVVSAVIHQHPRPFHLAIATRRDPPLPLASLRAEGRMTEIRLQDLRLNGEETAAFVNRVASTRIEGASAEALRKATEGWPAGLRLAALSLRKGVDVARLVEGLHGTGQHVMDYLATEVLAGVPPDIQERLLATAVLDRFCAPLCTALLDRTDGDATSPSAGDEFVAWLRRANLFVIPLDEEHRWLRYHHLFREVLRHLLSERRSSAEIATLHLNAAEWMARHDLPDEAIRHALAAGEIASAVDVVRAHRHALMNTENWPRLERWLRLFPAGAAETDPELLLAQGWLAMEKRYELGELEQVVGKARAAIDASRHDAAYHVRFRAELAILTGGLLYMGAQEGPALAVALQRAVDTLPADWEYARGIGFMHLAAALDQQGERRRAERLLARALREAGSGAGADGAQILTTLCFLSWFDAAPARLIRMAGRLLRFGQRRTLPRSVHFARYFLGLGHYDRNELAEAEVHLRLVVDAPYISALHNVAHSAFALALTQQARDAEEAAHETARLVSDLALEQGNHYLVSLCEAFDAELALRQGRRFEASEWARRYDPHPLEAVPRFYVAPLTWLRVLLAEDTVESRARAGAFLAEWQPHVERLHHTRHTIDTLLLRASWARAEGDTAGASAAFGRAVALARAGRVLRPFVDAGPRLGELLDGVHEGDAADFTREIAVRIGRAAISDPLPSVMPGTGTVPLATPLSNRETEILTLLAGRLSNKEIAARLHITSETVKRHTANIYQKLDVHGRREAVARATALGILQVA